MRDVAIMCLVTPIGLSDVRLNYTIYAFVIYLFAERIYRKEES